MTSVFHGALLMTRYCHITQHLFIFIAFNSMKFDFVSSLCIYFLSPLDATA